MVVLETSHVPDRVRDAADAWLVAYCLQYKIATLKRCAFYSEPTAAELDSGDWAEFSHGELPAGSSVFISGGLLWLPKQKPSGSPDLGDVIRAAVSG